MVVWNPNNFKKINLKKKKNNNNNNKVSVTSYNPSIEYDFFKKNNSIVEGLWDFNPERHF